MVSFSAQSPPYSSLGTAQDCNTAKMERQHCEWAGSRAVVHE
jgi:hypothetical protein